MHDHIYKSPARLSEHTNDSNSYFGALSFMLQVELLSLRKVSTASLLSWLTTPTGPHLVKVKPAHESRMTLAILWTSEVLADPKASHVGVGLVYKAPYIQSASFSEAYFNLKSASAAEADKRSVDSSLMFIQITEVSQVIPHPTVKPLFLDIKHSSLMTESNAPRPPQLFRGFRLNRTYLVQGDTCTTQVAIPCLEGEHIHYMITYQKAQTIPKTHLTKMIEAPLPVADENHWNIWQDPMFPSCLEEFKVRHKASSTSQGVKSSSQAGSTLTTTLTSATGSGPQGVCTLVADEVRDQVHEILGQIFALRVETIQEMGFVREVDRALARALMSEFARLQLIVGEDLNTSL